MFSSCFGVVVLSYVCILNPYDLTVQFIRTIMLNDLSVQFIWTIYLNDYSEQFIGTIYLDDYPYDLIEEVINHGSVPW